MHWSEEEARAIGSLIEKQLTTPQQYPLTLNALILACNQVSNRDPVVEYDERAVTGALATLKAAGFVRYVHPSHGRSATRYEHLVGEQLPADRGQLALIATLLLRGAQTAGELRLRTERMCSFDDISTVEDELDGLSRRQPPIVARLPRRPGQKEERWAQLLTALADGAQGQPQESRYAGVEHASAGPDARAAVARAPSRPVGLEVPAPPVAPERPGAAVGELRSELRELRAELTELRGEVAEVRAALRRLDSGTEAPAEQPGSRPQEPEIGH